MNYTILPTYGTPNANFDALLGAAESELAEQECIKTKHHQAFSSPVQSCHPHRYSCGSHSSEGMQLLTTGHCFTSEHTRYMPMLSTDALLCNATVHVSVFVLLSYIVMVFLLRLQR